MAGPRPVMLFRDRRDRIAIQQQQTGPMAATVGAAGFQTLQQHPHFSLAQQFDGEDDEIGRLGGGSGTAWAAMAHQHQQRAFAAAALHRQRGHSRPPLPHLTTSDIHQGPGPPGQGLEWDGGGRLARHVPVTGSRLDRDFLIDEPGRLRQQQPVVPSREPAPRGISRELLAELRIREAREDMFRKSEFLKSAEGRVHVGLIDDARERGVDLSRAYLRNTATQQLESGSRIRGVMFGVEDSGHAELISLYGTRSSARNLERAHAHAHAAVVPLSRKRGRVDDGEFERERLHRHRKLSGIDSPPDSIRLQALVGRDGTRQTKGEYRKLQQADEDEHEEGQLTPPRPTSSHHKAQHQHAVEFKTQHCKRDQDTSAASKTEASAKGDGNLLLHQNNSLFPSARESPRSPWWKSSSSRPSTTRENNGRLLGDQFEPLSSSKDQPLTKRERPPSPRSKDNERMLTRLDRVGGGDVERFSVLSSDLLEVRKKKNKESESRARHGNYKAAEKGHDILYYKKELQHQGSDSRRDLRSPLRSRKTRMVGDMLDDILLEKRSKDSSERNENDLMRKTSRSSALKDGRQLGEMTISVQKHGQRTVKVEDYRPRDINMRRVSKSSIQEQKGLHRGGRLRTNSAERDRLPVVKRKDSQGRPTSAAQDKALRAQSSKVGASHQQHLQRSGTQEPVPPCSEHIKKELIASTDKYDMDQQRHQSIFSRLASLKRETSPTGSRTVSEAFRQEISLPQGSNRVGSLPSARKKSPTAQVRSSKRDGSHEDVVDFQGFPVCTVDTEGALAGVEAGLMGVSGKSSVFDRPFSVQVEPCDRLSKASLQTLDFQQPEDLGIHSKIDSMVSSKSHLARESRSASEKGLEGFVKDCRVSDCAVIHSPEQMKSQVEGVALPCGETGVHFRLGSLGMGTLEVREQSPGNGFKSFPKVISTGHKKDQVSKKCFVNADEAALEGPSLLVDVPPVEKAIQESPGQNISIVSADLMPTDSRQDPTTSTALSKWCGNVPLVDHEDPPLQANMEEKNKPRSICSYAEIVPKPSLSACVGSVPSGSSLSPFKPPLTPFSKPFEPEQILSTQAPGPLPVLQGYKEVPSLSVDQPDLDVETENGLSSSPVATSTVSTPREIRLFGANLNAPVGGPVELKQAEDENGFCTSDSQEMKEVQVSVQLERILENESKVAIQEVENESGLLEVLTGDEQELHLSEPSNCEDNFVIHQDVVKVPMSLACDVPLVQAQVKESSSMTKEQHTPPSVLQKTQAAAPGKLKPSHGTGGHTWRRGTSSTAAENSTSMFRGTSSFGGVLQNAGRSRSAQKTAYVRKGNSLVRAAGAVSTLHISNDIKAITSAIPGQARPFTNPRPMVKPNPFRSPFIAKPINSKSFYPVHRKYVAPSVESDANITSRLKPNSTSIPHSSTESGMLLPPPSSPLKAPSQVPSKTAFTTQAVPLSTTWAEQQTMAIPCPDLPFTDKSDDSLSEAGMFRVAANPSSTAIQKPVLGNRLYVRRKANQLVVAPPQSVDCLPTEIHGSQTGKTGLVPGLYIKRKTNQLVRSNAGKGSSIQSAPQDLLKNSLSPEIADEQEGGSTFACKKLGLGRVAMRQKKLRTGPTSWVWTLSGGAVGRAGNAATQSLRTGPLLFPWKRQNSMRTPVRPQRLKPLPEGKKGSLLSLMSKRLRKVRPVQPVYTRSADGFSLHRSGVMSLGGGNLKWTKSLEKRAKQASEAATKAVAAAERRKREKKEAVVEAASKMKAERKAARKAARGEGGQIVWVGLVRYKMDASSKTLQRIPELPGTAGKFDTTASMGLTKMAPLLTPRRSIIGGAVYLRVGNGNQLVQDPKAASRALASEKVRWSLHNARSRGAKKQQYCQFFTKFGKCDKENGKCSYIHDPDKVAICTKFLKGNCTVDQCLLTHKVIPERMPDCSFFLEGLCTKENCSYRHVNVNPKAPYCDGFLRGYCKDGDKCNKKHTYVCSVYAETGECLGRSSCKFHHPKKKIKPCTPVSNRKVSTKGRRRYFSTIEPDAVTPKTGASNSSGDNLLPLDHGDILDEGSMEFISLSNIEADEDQNVTVQSESWPGSRLTPGIKGVGFVEDLEKWIKPTFLLEMTLPATTAH